MNAAGGYLKVFVAGARFEPTTSIFSGSRLLTQVNVHQHDTRERWRNGKVAALILSQSLDALLISILLPSLARAREQAKSGKESGVLASKQTMAYAVHSRGRDF